MELPVMKQEKIKLNEINQYLTCYLCKGYLIDATTISECLHSFCRSCIIKFLQDNSYCPVCELIINKAKPNLKLDKTLQDIVYKLVPELFLKEMTRRKAFYKQYPQISARVSPEERGEDTERTIFNPQEVISLSLEYICDDSTPGAIRIPGLVVDPEGLRNNGTAEESPESLMKRYLLCPGMCRIEVLKKFVQNKYNVDTNQFFIDILYKRVPLPDHYTLIDIAYIYSWQRNELMKFFFRIIDLKKAKRAESPSLPEFLPRQFTRTRSQGEKINGSSRRKESAAQRKSVAKIHNSPAKHSSHEKIKRENGVCDNKHNDSHVNKYIDRIKSKSEIKEECNGLTSGYSERTIKNGDNIESQQSVKSEDLKKASCTADSFIGVRQLKTVKSNIEIKGSAFEKDSFSDGMVNKVPSEDDRNEAKKISTLASLNAINDDKDVFSKTYCNTKQTEIKIEIPKSEIKGEIMSPPDIKPGPKFEKTQSKLLLKIADNIIDAPSPVTSKSLVINKPVSKSYTSITLNRTDNVEIITKIEPVSNWDGQPIGHHIVKQTIKKVGKVKSRSPAAKKITPKVGKVAIPRIVISKAAPQNGPKAILNEKQSTNGNKLVNDSANKNVEPKSDVEVEDEKSKFLKSIELTAKSAIQKMIKIDTHKPPNKTPIIPKVTGGQKRKNSSPLKNDKIKIPKMEKKQPVKIILHEKPSTSKAGGLSKDQKRDNGLQSLIDSCKINIPSSLSITIKESSENRRLPSVAPPVKNYIEILKLPDESSSATEKVQGNDSIPKEPTKLDISKFCDNDSEQKVDQDLSEIAKSLTEKIPMSTTVSHIIGPKQQFQIPVKTNAPPKFQIQPSPVPEINKALNVPPKDGLAKLNPRSPQTFQKIFEESIKKPDGSKSALDLNSDQSDTTASSKRNILEIASQLIKKSKLEQEKGELEVKLEDVPLPKVPIPRLPHPRPIKPPQKQLDVDQINKLAPQTVASLHSSSLGMNYTVSVGQKSPTKTTKANGIVSPVKSESVPKLPESKPLQSPLNEPKSVITDFKVPSPSLGSPKLPEFASSSSPRPKTPSPKHSPKSSPIVKHMYAPTVPVFSQKVPSPMNRFASLSPKLPHITKPSSTSPRPPVLNSPHLSPSSSSASQNGSALSPNEILEKYNIQNLAQLTASFNLNPAVLATNQLAAFQHAMLLKHFEMQNRQNWLNRNQGPLLQYEKYLQSLNGGQNHLLGNIKDN